MARILVAGDFCLNARMSSMTLREVEYSLQEIKPILESVDYSLINLECTVSDKQYKPIPKCGPNLINTSVALDAIKSIGFNAVTLANNHIADFGHDAMVDTLNLIEEKSLDYVGGGKNLLDASKILYKQIAGKKIAFINCCEHEFTIATETIGGANPLNIPAITRDILTAKKITDYVIVIIHGGSEHYNLPTPRMQDTYRFFVEMGADVVINHHQHCYSGYEHYKDGYIFYGLGNFCFDLDSKRDSAWNEGYVVVIDIQDDVNVELIPYIQCNNKEGIELLNEKQAFVAKINKLSMIIHSSELLLKAYNDFVNSKIEEYLWIYQLSHNRLLRKLNKLGLLPKKFAKEVLPMFLTQERKLCILSYFQCESHNDIMQNVLRNML